MPITKIELAQSRPDYIKVGGEYHIFRDGKWVTAATATPVTDQSVIDDLNGANRIVTESGRDRLSSVNSDVAPIIESSTVEVIGEGPDIVTSTQSGPQLGAPGTAEAVRPNTDISELANSLEFTSLPEDQQELVRSVFQVIAENDVDNAERLAAAFDTAEKVADPFFKQQIRIARDTIERGFVSIDQEEEFKEKQLKTQLQDLQTDLETRKEFLGLEEQSALRGIEREFKSNLETVQQSLAARGMSSSSRRQETEGILRETTGDLRETTKRRFGAQQSEADLQRLRGERDTQTEVERLNELTKGKKLELFRSAEETLGTAGLSDLNATGSESPLGDIVGDIPQAQAKDIISGATQLIF